MARKIEHWKATKPVERILLVITEGKCHWDPARNDFDPARSTSIPPSLRGVFSEEPLWLDLRWRRGGEKLNVGHADSVWGVAYSIVGNAIASASQDHTVRLWPMTIKAWIRHACALAGRNLRQDEWNQFMGSDRPYVRTCSGLPSGHRVPRDAPSATYGHLDPSG